MTRQSKFNERADGAAEAIKKKMGVEPTKVEVGPDGRPPPPPPPPGSYMAMMQEQRKQQIEAAAQQRPTEQETLSTMEGAEPEPETPPTTEAEPETTPEDSPNVKKRFQQLTARLRQAEQEKQAALQKAEELSQSKTELEKRVQTIEQQHKVLVEENLDNMDPELRMQVMQDARMQELLSGVEQRILQNIMPTVETLREANRRQEMERLSDKYPNFDIEFHAELITTYQRGNPNSTIEQAYKAVAEGDELLTRSQTSAPVPPTPAPGRTGNGMPRYAPTPEPDPEEEMIADAQRIRQLRASNDPAKQKEGLRLADKNISDRLAHRFGR